MRRLAIDPQTRGGTRGGEKVDRYPRQNLVVSPGIRVRPIVQFLKYPSQQADGAIGERVPERLRFRGLDLIVAGSFFLEPFAAGEAGFLGVGVGCEGVLEAVGGVVGGGRGLGGHHVDVGCFAGGGVEEADGAGDPGAPVAALSYCFFLPFLVFLFNNVLKSEWNLCSRLRKQRLTILQIAEFQHQVVTGFGVLRQRKAFLCDALREAVIRQGGCDDVECGFAVLHIGE